MNLIEAQKLVKQKEFGKALNIFLKLDKKNSNDLKIFFYLGLIYYELNKYEKSIKYYDKCLKIDPKSISTLHNLAITFQALGKFEKAKRIYLSILKLNKLNIRAYYGLYTLDNNNLSDEMFENLIEIKNTNKINLYEKGFINFLLSKKEKKNKKYKKELDYLESSHEDIYKSNLTYNRSSLFYYNKIICNHYNKIKFNDYNTEIFKKSKSEPIFIIGLPRSGSTLIESILTSSKEKIFSFGECNVINMSVLNEIGKKIYKKDFDIKSFEFSIQKESIRKNVFNRYFQFNNKIQEDTKFIDKSLENFFNIEIIYNIYPNAKFIHTFRNPVDSVISIYQSMLPELSWTHNVENILIYIDNYLKVMKTFNLKYRESIINIDLENFTKNSTEVSKDIFNFCNLEWNQDVLKFYKRKNLYSKTLSNTQIRSKIEKYNLDKYKPYFEMLNKYKKSYSWLNIV